MTAWIDARAGLTGDMWLGALVAVGASLESIERGVQTLGVGEVRVAMARVRRGGREAVSVRVRPPSQTPGVATVSQVQALLEFAALDDAVRARALATFDALAEAEAAAHDASLDDVRFHEVAMLDDLASIVGASIGIEHLGTMDWVAGAVGVSADPDPVADWLLRAHPTRTVDADRPIVTPVGAAILVTTATTHAPDPPGLAIEAEGAGAAARGHQAGLLHLTLGTLLDPEA